MIKNYKCESCQTVNAHYVDGRRKTPDSVWVTCQNSKCEYFLTTRRMWLIKDKQESQKDSPEIAELKNKIIEDTRLWYALGCDYFKIEEDHLTIDFNLNNSIGGIAYTGRRLIEYNLTLASENQEDFINKTVPHEIAHIIANRVHGKNQGHGAGWKQVMKTFNIEATRCHSYSVKNVGRPKITYTCECGESYEVGINLHSKIQKGSNHYCRNCRRLLRDMTHEK